VGPAEASPRRPRFRPQLELSRPAAQGAPPVEVLLTTHPTWSTCRNGGLSASPTRPRSPPRSASWASGAVSKLSVATCSRYARPIGQHAERRHRCARWMPTPSSWRKPRLRAESSPAILTQRRGTRPPRLTAAGRHRLLRPTRTRPRRRHRRLTASYNFGPVEGTIHQFFRRKCSAPQLRPPPASESS
jgi:hypothetical protein